MLTELFSNLSQFSLGLMQSAGYPGLFLLSFLDRAAMNLVPAELILPLSGFLVAQEKFNFFWVLLVAACGGLLGDLIIYFLSAKYGRRLLERFGKYFFISRHDLEHVDKMFLKHGQKLVFIGRWLPIVRAFTAIPAGISRMSRKTFALYTFLGSFLGNFPFIYVGFAAGENWEALKPYLRNLDWLIVGVVVASVFWYIYRHRRRRHLTHN